MSFYQNPKSIPRTASTNIFLHLTVQKYSLGPLSSCQEGWKCLECFPAPIVEKEPFETSWSESCAWWGILRKKNFTGGGGGGVGKNFWNMWRSHKFPVFRGSWEMMREKEKEVAWKWQFILNEGLLVWKLEGWEGIPEILSKNNQNWKKNVSYLSISTISTIIPRQCISISSCNTDHHALCCSVLPQLLSRENWGKWKQQSFHPRLTQVTIGRGCQDQDWGITSPVTHYISYRILRKLNDA